MVFWMMNTIRKVSTVVPVLMTSCHPLEKWNSGPEIAQAIVTATAARNTTERPVHVATLEAKRSKNPFSERSVPFPFSRDRSTVPPLNSRGVSSFLPRREGTQSAREEWDRPQPLNGPGAGGGSSSSRGCTGSGRLHRRRISARADSGASSASVRAVARP